MHRCTHHTGKFARKPAHQLFGSHIQPTSTAYYRPFPAGQCSSNTITIGSSAAKPNPTPICKCLLSRYGLTRTRTPCHIEKAVRRHSCRKLRGLCAISSCKREVHSPYQPRGPNSPHTSCRINTDAMASAGLCHLDPVLCLICRHNHCTLT